MEKQKIFFTSDLHFGHENVIRFDNRPFDTVEEMDEEMIKHWNAKVGKGDIVYVLGDFIWKAATNEAVSIIRRLNGQIILIKGNHDRFLHNAAAKKALAGIKDYDDICVILEDGTTRRCILSHYFIPFYNGHRYQAIHLHGHSRLTEEAAEEVRISTELNEKGYDLKIYNVGCMYWNYTPVTLDEILEKNTNGQANKNSMFGETGKITAQTSTEVLSDSLKKAIMSFILAASIKKSRGFDKYNSMLIHTARYKNPSTTLKPLVADYVAELYQGIKYHFYEAIKEFKHLWKTKFEKVSQMRLGVSYKDTWDNIAKYILPTLESTMKNIKVINGDSGDMLDYSLATSGDYIVIGGDKLSRGLTLEWLVVSYYYRNSRTYDSLLQMGRWFGYRKGWSDICRVFTTVRFINDFITVGKVIQQFKADVEDMYNLKLNPREVGQRIMYSPNLIPTARAKMKSITKYKVSFSGRIQQVITFGREYIKSNFEAAGSTDSVYNERGIIVI